MSSTDLAESATVVEKLQQELEELKEHLTREREKTRDSEFALLSGDMEEVQVPAMRQRRILKIPGAKILTVSWLPDKRSIICSTHDGRLVLWDAFASKSERYIQHVCHW